MTNARRIFPVIDIHAHVVEPHVYAQTVNHNVISGFGARRFEEHPEPGSPRWPTYSKMVDPAVQLGDMDRAGIDINLVSTTTVSQGTWWADPASAAAMDRRANEWIAEWVRRHPDRFVGSFTLPMQDVRLALEELDYAVTTLGLRVVNVSSSIGGIYLGDPQLRPFWQAVHDLGLAVFVHPHGMTDPHYQKYAFWNSIGQPIEETLAMASLIYEGIFDAFPGVTVVIVHGGGYLPHYTGRLNRAYTHHPVSAKNLTRMPSEYLRCFYYDSCVYDPTILDALIDRVGVDRIVLGSDYPFGEDDPVGTLRRSRVSESDAEAMLSTTPAKILGIAKR